MKHDFLRCSGENFLEQRNIRKGSLVFPEGIFQNNGNFGSISSKLSFDTSVRPSRLRPSYAVMYNLGLLNVTWSSELVTN